MSNQKEENDSDLLLQFLTNSFSQINYKYKLNRFFSEDILSFNSLGTLIYNYPYIPFTRGSLRPFCLNHIINDIIINDRKQIIEFGSGIAKILIGRLIKKNNLDATLTSIEHDLEWFKLLYKILSKENLNNVMRICYALIKKNSTSFDEAIRNAKQYVIKFWEEELSIRFNYSCNTLAYYYNGSSFFTEPYAYY
ncbi:hypothetical protein [Thalassobellus sediminis]|uniref:hypothetical protein n=1 Tax=Thalassobellus sediminis TaxID=3367753 RepID=UPI0037971380